MSRGHVAPGKPVAYNYGLLGIHFGLPSQVKAEFGPPKPGAPKASRRRPSRRVDAFCGSPRFSVEWLEALPWSLRSPILTVLVKKALLEILEKPPWRSLSTLELQRLRSRSMMGCSRFGTSTVCMYACMCVYIYTHTYVVCMYDSQNHKNHDITTTIIIRVIVGDGNASYSVYLWRHMHWDIARMFWGKGYNTVGHRGARHINECS